MATTLSNSYLGKHRSDHQIEKYRLELNWSKILDKLKSAKVSGLNSFSLNEEKRKLFNHFPTEYAKFLEGEAQLELYFQQYPLTDSRHIEDSRESLIGVENLLKSVSSSYSFEGQCLLGKLYYAQARYDECLTNIA